MVDFSIPFCLGRDISNCSLPYRKFSFLVALKLRDHHQICVILAKEYWLGIFHGLIDLVASKASLDGFGSLSLLVDSISFEPGRLRIHLFLCDSSARWWDDSPLGVPKGCVRSPRNALHDLDVSNHVRRHCRTNMLETCRLGLCCLTPPCISREFRSLVA